MKEFGATIARYDLPTIYKMLFKLGTPAFVIRRINVAYRTYLRGGSMRGETPSGSSAIVPSSTADSRYTSAATALPAGSRLRWSFRADMTCG